MLNDLLQPGKTLEIYYNEGNVNNATAHIRAIVDDCVVVYRVWFDGGWIYKLDRLLFFEELYGRGFLSEAEAA